MVFEKPHQWLTSSGGDRYSNPATSRVVKYGHHFNDQDPGSFYEYLELSN